MGVDLVNILSKRKILLEELAGRSIAVDAYNALYQFLAIIRGVAGEPLMDRSGRVTSHLSGLFYRTVNMAEKGIKLAYVFDGKPPALKEAELKYRMAVKDEAVVKYKKALKRGDLEGARKYAQMTSRLKDEMIKDAKRLISLLGIPWVQAPSEGEAQAAYIASKGDVWAASSQDYDSLLFNSPRLVRNLAISGRRKLPNKNVYIEVEPEIVGLHKMLEELEITREQLIDLGILVGTDFNPGGVKGLGSKKALKLLKEHGSIEGIRSNKLSLDLSANLGEIRKIFLQPTVTEEYRLEWSTPRMEESVAFLCDERDFNEIRVRNALERMVNAVKQEKSKRTLESYFGS